MVTCPQESQDSIRRGKPGGKGKPVNTTFQYGETILQRLTRRILCARVSISLARLTNTVLHVGGSQVDRRHDCPVVGIRLLPGMDCKCFEFHSLSCRLSTPSPAARVV